MSDLDIGCKECGWPFYEITDEGKYVCAKCGKRWWAVVIRKERENKT